MTGGLNMGSSINIDPNHDGVVMFSPSTVFFNDAQPRPDGTKIYHVFEQNPANNITDNNKDFEINQEELFSKASEDNIQNIQQTLAKNGIWMQNWSNYSSNSLVTVVPPQILLTNMAFFKENVNDSYYNALLFNPNIRISFYEYPNNPNNTREEQRDENSSGFHHITVFKVHQFCISYPIDLQTSSNRNKLIRRLYRRGITEVDFEPENFRITVKTKRPAHIVLSLLKKIDPNVFLLSTTQNVVIEEPNKEYKGNI